MDMDDGTCDGCIYALPTVTDDLDVTVKCRRFPPVVFVLDGEVTQTFPDAVNRCGEYKENDDDPFLRGSQFKVGFVDSSDKYHVHTEEQIVDEQGRWRTTRTIDRSKCPTCEELRLQEAADLFNEGPDVPSIIVPGPDEKSDNG